MLRAARLPWPTAAVTVRSPGTMSPPAKMPACPVIMSGPTMTVPSGLNSMPGTRFKKRAVGLLAERQHDGIGLEGLESPRSAAACPFASSSIRSTVRVGPAISLMLASHLILTPSAIASSASKACAGM